MAKGTIVSKSKIKRKPGFLYFVDRAGHVRSVKMARRKKKRAR